MRGDNGILLKEFLGIGDLYDLTYQFNEGFDRDLALYPMGLPRNGFAVHNKYSSMMIGKIWRKHSTVMPESKWTLLATFNVMQHFFYNASQAFEDLQKGIDYLTYLKTIFDNVCPKLLELNNELKQYIYGEANSLESHDVLHTMLSLAITSSFMPAEYKQINKKQLIESLITKNLQRTMRYNNLNSYSDLSKETGLYPLFIFAPLLLEFLSGKSGTAAETMATYQNMIKDIKTH